MSNGLHVGSTTEPSLHLVSLANREDFRLSLTDRAGLVDRITAILQAHNPVQLPVVVEDEFRPEAETIAARLQRDTTPAQTRTVVHQEFTNWFDDEMAGPAGRYTAVAAEVWQAANQWFGQDPVEKPVA